MTRHVTITLQPRPRGFHLITSEIMSHLPVLPDQGILHVFIQHTSAGLTINENADPTVLSDFERFFNHIVPEGMRFVEHTMEGQDDMPAHIKSALVGASITIPIVDGRLALGTWQGIYLCEFRNRPHARRVVVSIVS